MPRQGSTNGPGWMEVSSMLGAIDQLHGATSWIDMSHAGSSLDTSLRVVVVSVLPVYSGPARVRRVVSALIWPNVDSAELVSAIYKLLFEHDYRISKEVYKQERLDLA